MKVRTPEQNRRIWSLVNELARRAQLSREDVEALTLRPITRRISAQEHTSKLTPGQADQTIAALEGEVRRYAPAQPAAPAPAPAPVAEPRKGTITPAQQALIQGLYQMVGYASPEQQRAFAMRQIRLPWAQTQAQADALIEPLKAMALRAVVPADAWQRAQALASRGGLDAWKKQFIADLCRQFSEANDAGTLDKVLTPGKLLKLLECEAAAS